MVYFLCKAYDSGRQNCCFALSLPVRGAWVEIAQAADELSEVATSLPVRGAWVEIGRRTRSAARQCVAPRAGSVG